MRKNSGLSMKLAQYVEIPRGGHSFPFIQKERGTIMIGMLLWVDFCSVVGEDALPKI